MTTIPLAEVAGIVALTLQVTFLGTAIGACLGIPLGAWIGGRGGGRAFLRTLIYTFYGLPPVVAGLVLYLLLSARGPLGGLGILFTPWAIVAAEVILTTPLIAGLTIAALAEVPASVREAVASMAPSRALHHWTLVKEARFGILAAIMVGFGRALAEVAGALIVGGNIRHETRTLGTAIVQEVGQGNFTFALVLAGILVGLALATFLVLARLQRAARGGASS